MFLPLPLTPPNASTRTTSSPGRRDSLPFLSCAVAFALSSLKVSVKFLLWRAVLHGPFCLPCSLRQPTCPITASHGRSAHRGGLLSGLASVWDPPACATATHSQSPPARRLPSARTCRLGFHVSCVPEKNFLVAGALENTGLTKSSFDFFPSDGSSST